jgi:hypothetical protein
MYLGEYESAFDLEEITEPEPVIISKNSVPSKKTSSTTPNSKTIPPASKKNTPSSKSSNMKNTKKTTETHLNGEYLSIEKMKTQVNILHSLVSILNT